jgi:hypothetical protein
MKHLIYGLAICLLVAGCEKYDSPKSGEVTIPQKQLTESETILKENLQKAAIILVDVIQDEDVINELSMISKEDRPFYSLTFKDLFEEAKGTGESFKILKERFLSKCSSADTKGGADEFAAFLADKGCYIYCPYPLSFYPKGTNSFTVAAHPVDNDFEGRGFRFDGRKKIEVTVNEKYADKYPVILVMPKDEGQDELINYNKEVESALKGDPVYEVTLGKIRCADYCGGLFEGELELMVSRGYPKLNMTTNEVEGTFSTVIPIKYPKDYAKAAKNNWTVHSNGGWYSVYVVWDSNWQTTKAQQCVLVYEYDQTKEISVSATVGYKKDDFSPTISTTVKTTYRGDFLGIAEWDRNWFYATNTKPGPYDEVKDGLTVRKTCAELKLTMPTRTIY